MLSIPFALLKIALVAALTFCILNISIDGEPLFTHLRKFIFVTKASEQMSQAVEDMKKRASEAVIKSLKQKYSQAPSLDAVKDSEKKKEKGHPKIKDSDPIKDLIKKKSPQT